MILIISLCFLSCEDVVQVNLKPSEPRLVVEASIKWQKGTSGKDQVIKLTLTAPFFQQEIPPATGAQVKVVTDDGDEFIFTEREAGIYINQQFFPRQNTTYHLKISYNNQQYTATGNLISVPAIQEVEQGDNGGINGKDIELKAYFNDPPSQNNYYLIKFFYSDLALQIFRR